MERGVQNGSPGGGQKWSGAQKWSGGSKMGLGGVAQKRSKEGGGLPEKKQSGARGEARGSKMH